MNLFKDLNFKSVDNIKKFELDYLKEQVTKWLEDCLSDLKTSFSQNFKYANNLKSLVIIRDSIIEFESNIQNDAFPLNVCIRNDIPPAFHATEFIYPSFSCNRIQIPLNYT